MKPLPQCAGSAAEAKDIVRALSEGRVRITPRPVVMVPPAAAAPTFKVVVAAAGPPQRREPFGAVSERIRGAARRLCALGNAFSAVDIRRRAGEDIESSHIRTALAELEMDGRIIVLDRDDARRRPARTGNELRAKQWLPVKNS